VKFYSQSEDSSSKDYSGIGILISNALVIVYAMVENLDPGPMMVIYWAQSVIIGFFHFFRILLLKSFSTEGFTSNGTRVPETSKGKWSTALFFAVHYGFFHLIYFIFIVGFGSWGLEDEVTPEVATGRDGVEPWFLLSVLGFVFGHAYSFYRNVRADLKRRPNLGIMMFLPYARIIPMHLTIIFGNEVASGRQTVFLFSVLKTGADYLMHIVEHRILQKNVEPSA
jgi:hypothetical protein